jgi:DNA-directed RNA polymerase subunit RPC12/RpoP
VLNLQKSVCEFSISKLLTVPVPLLFSSHIDDVIHKLLVLHKIKPDILHVHCGYEILIKNRPPCTLEDYFIKIVSIQPNSIV